MSTTTVSVRSTTEEAILEDVRNREAEAREAARRAAERAARVEEEKRRREALEREMLRRRLEAANQIIARQDALYQKEVSRLDEASRHLPDLSFRAPSLPGLSSGVAGNPEKLEEYAGKLTSTVQNFSRELDGAIAEAERLLARRIAKATAWRTASDLEQSTAVRTQAGREVAARLNEPVVFPALPEKPGTEVELEAVEGYVVALRSALDAINRQYARLIACEEARERAAALAGSHVKTRSASEAHARHESARIASAQAKLGETVEAALSSSGMALNELPDAMQFLIEDALLHAHTLDRTEQVVRWVAREKQHQDGMRRAMFLMQRAPETLHDDAALTQRWANLLVHLQRVAGGLEELTPSLDREYEQICADAQRNLNTAFTKADWVKAMSEQGFEILEREDGQGLVVVDLDHPEVWLEATELESPDGGFGAVLELKTDMEPGADQEAAITARVCSRLGQVAGAAASKVQTQAEVIERKNRITRGRRPSKARKAMAL